MNEWRAWVVVNERTGKLYDEKVYWKAEWAETSVKQGSYYAALHAPVVMNLKDAMKRWMAVYRQQHQLARLPFDEDYFNAMEPKEALIVCKFLGWWQLERQVAKNP